MILSLSGVIGYNLFSYWALNYTSAVHVTLINSTSPVFMTILAYVSIKEKITRKLVISIIFSMGGVLWVMTQGDLVNLIYFDFNIGDFIMIVGVFFWAIYTIELRKFIGTMTAISTFGYSLIVALPILLPLTLIELWFVPIVDVSSIDITSLIYLGIFPSIFSFLMWNRAVSIVGPSKASIFINLTPVFGGVLSYFLLGEVLTLAHLIGALLVFSGVLVVTKRSKGEEKKGGVSA